MGVRHGKSGIIFYYVIDSRIQLEILSGFGEVLIYFDVQAEIYNNYCQSDISNDGNGSTVLLIPVLPHRIQVNVEETPSDKADPTGVNLAF